MKLSTRMIVRGLIAALVPVASWAGPVNVNTADAATLARELDGIGPAKAQAIVDYRQKNGAFQSPDELLKVEGIGQRVLEMNKGNIRVERGGAPAEATKKPAKDE
jgi:competence protein ComEA